MTQSHYNPRPAARRTAVEALVVVACVTAILLVGFNDAPTSRATTETDLGEITLLDVEARPEVMTWLEYHDPALFVTADRTYGYSAWGGLAVVHRPPDHSAATNPERRRPAPEPVSLEPVAAVEAPPAVTLGMTAVKPVAVPRPPEVEYPLVFRQGRPVADWQVPPALLDAARKARVASSRAVYSADLRCIRSDAGSDDAAWRKEFFLTMSREAAAASGGLAGEVEILWKEAQP